ncbi:hypothetical protein, partial [Streptomyces yerevanensis]|uniref:hypothetical protein n=1 Tax=Streptomyces yerevanensis TaxID=66378 RepID=UPI001B809067
MSATAPASMASDPPIEQTIIRWGDTPVPARSSSTPAEIAKALRHGQRFSRRHRPVAAPASATLRVSKIPSMVCDVQVLVGGRWMADRRVRLIDRA